MIVEQIDDKNNKILTITIDTSTVYNATKVCLKFLRNGQIDTIMSQPFYLEVSSKCSPYFNAKQINDLIRYIYSGQTFETLFYGSDFYTSKNDDCKATFFDFKQIGTGNLDYYSDTGRVVLKKNWLGTIKLIVTISTINEYQVTTNLFSIK